MQTNEQTLPARPCRVSVVADERLVEDLRAHQRRVQQQTGMRVSLSQVAGSLLRRSLEQCQSMPT